MVLNGVKMVLLMLLPITATYPQDDILVKAMELREGVKVRCKSD